jgi:hypothetical protein
MTQKEAMTTTAPRQDASAGSHIGQVDLSLPVIPIPVSDIDRVKAFYEGLSWRLDADFRHNGDRALQFTPSVRSARFTSIQRARRDPLKACSW